MKYIISIVSLLLLWANSTKSIEQPQQLQTKTIVPSHLIPSTKTDKNILTYQHHSSTWTLSGAAYSGYVESYYADGSIKQCFAVLDGLKEGKALDWFEDGHLKFTAHYHKGKLHGEKKVWYRDSTHHVASQLNYQMGKLHGLQKKWYATGEKFKLLNLKMGKEDGLQQAFRKNGALYANYEARDGRVFGLKRASLCFELENENLVYNQKTK